MPSASVAGPSVATIFVRLSNIASDSVEPACKFVRRPGGGSRKQSEVGMKTVRFTVGIAAAAALSFSGVASAQTTPTVLDPKLEVRPVATGLSQPVQME